MSEVHVSLPWSAVLHDNHKHVAIVSKGHARLILSPQYRATKERARYYVLKAMQGHALFLGDVHLTATVWMPDNRRRDAGNYRKLLTDVCSGIVYADDSQLTTEIWHRGGIDREHPRIDLTLTPVPG